MAPRQLQKPIRGSYRGVFSGRSHRGNDQRLESTKGSASDSHEVLDPKAFDNIHGENFFPLEKPRGRRGRKSTILQSTQPLPKKTNPLPDYAPMMEDIGIWVMDSDGLWTRDYDVEYPFTPIFHATPLNPPRMPTVEEEEIWVLDRGRGPGDGRR